MKDKKPIAAKSNTGIVTGIVFAGSSVLSAATFFVPILLVLPPGSFFEWLASALVNNKPYSNVGLMTIGLITTTSVLTFLLLLFGIEHSAKKTGIVLRKQIIKAMVVMLFLVHPLGFYIYWASMQFRSDGQLALLCFLTVPFSGLLFILLGSIIDKVKNRAIEKFRPQ
jgi:hypothetical protein